MKDDERGKKAEDSSPPVAWGLFIGTLGEIPREQDEQRHVKDIDRTHHRMIDLVDVIQVGDDVAQDDQDDQQAFQRVYS